MDVRLRSMILTAAMSLLGGTILAAAESPLPVAPASLDLDPGDLPPLPPRENDAPAEATPLQNAAESPAENATEPAAASEGSETTETAETGSNSTDSATESTAEPADKAADPKAPRPRVARAVLDLVVKTKERTAKALRSEDGWRPSFIRKTKTKKSSDKSDATEDAQEDDAEEAALDSLEATIGEAVPFEITEQRAEMNVQVLPAAPFDAPSLLDSLNFDERNATPVFEGLGAVDGFEGIWNIHLSPEVNRVLADGFHLGVELTAAPLPAPAALPPTRSVTELFADATPIDAIRDGSKPAPEAAPAPPVVEGDAAPMPPPVPPLSEERKAQIDAALADLHRPVSAISVTTALHETVPRNLAAESQMQLQPIHIWGAPWPKSCPKRYTQPFCHRPLYFEEPNLERCGTNCCGVNAGIFQPGASMLHFVGNTLILPYRLVVRPPCVLQPTLGDCPTCHTYGCDALELLPVGYEPIDLSAFWSN